MQWNRPRVTALAVVAALPLLASIVMSGALSESPNPCGWGILGILLVAAASAAVAVSVCVVAAFSARIRRWLGPILAGLAVGMALGYVVAGAIVNYRTQDMLCSG